MSNSKVGSIKYGIKKTQIGISGLWLLALYPALLWLILGTLSGYGFQEKVTKPKANNANSLTIPTILRRASELLEIEREEIEAEEDLRILNEELKKAENVYQEKYEQYQFLSNEFYGLQNDIVAILKVLYQKENTETPEIILYEEVVQGIELFSEDEKIKKLGKEYKESYKESNQVNQQMNAASVKAEGIKYQKPQYENRLSNIRDKAERVLKEANIGDYISELNYMSVFKFKRFATMPSQLLTLILTLSMGALGSLILITLDYFSVGSERPLSWYLFRPLLGMVTAVAVFILAKAGQLTISDASASTSVAENLNPYFISFLGIISGLLSEQAVERIQKAGKLLFRQDKEKDETERWAIGLGVEMKRQKKKVQDLLEFVSASEKTVKEWCSEKRTVSPKEQQIISAWLGIPKRKLFTDIRPTFNEVES